MKIDMLRITLVAAIGLLTIVSPVFAVDDPLPSWNDGAAKTAILDFVSATTTPGASSFLEPSARIAVFDNDGTLWPENPMPFQVAFAIDEIKRLAPQHPEWNDNPAIKAALALDLHSLIEDGYKGLKEVMAVTHAGITTDEFRVRVTAWATTAKHPRYDRRYLDLTYRPMIEVLNFLRSYDYKTYIVSGGGADFMRVFANEIYGIQANQVIGSIGPVRVERRDGVPVMIKEPGVDFIDDHDGKIVGIHRQIGMRPVACFGNSDGDLTMLQWTTVGHKPAFGLIVHHTDDAREYAYDEKPKSSGKLIEGLVEAEKNQWTVVNMSQDWKTMFSDDEPAATSSSIPQDVDWVVEDISGGGVIDRSNAFVRFDSENRVAGSTGCNRFFGSATIDGNKIMIGGLGMTRRACAEALMNQETRFTETLSRVTRYKHNAVSGLLYFLDESGTTIIRMSRSQEQ